MSTAEINIGRFSGGILEAQVRMEDLQTQHENFIAAGNTAEANRVNIELRRESSKMKRFESYTKMWEAALEVVFYLIGIGTTILKIRV